MNQRVSCVVLSARTSSVIDVAAAGSLMSMSAAQVLQVEAEVVVLCSKDGGSWKSQSGAAIIVAVCYGTAARMSHMAGS